jgi:hypothetical protein
MLACERALDVIADFLHAIEDADQCASLVERASRRRSRSKLGARAFS